MDKQREMEQIIGALRLEPLQGEGGLFASTYVSPKRTAGGRPAATAIYYMLRAGAFSHLHRLDADELWHFYTGDAVEMLLLMPDGSHRQVVLGPGIAAGQRPQQLVPAGVWQGARLAAGGTFALMGTTMSPGYRQKGYWQGSASALAREYPACAEEIARLCGKATY